MLTRSTAALALLMLAACGAAHDRPVTFALVAYEDRLGALYADVLDSGLSADDCAFALGAAYRLPMPSATRLVTCEAERK